MGAFMRKSISVLIFGLSLLTIASAFIVLSPIDKAPGLHFSLHVFLSSSYSQCHTYFIIHASSSRNTRSRQSPSFLDPDLSSIMLRLSSSYWDVYPWIYCPQSEYEGMEEE